MHKDNQHKTERVKVSELKKEFEILEGYLHELNKEELVKATAGILFINQELVDYLGESKALRICDSLSSELGDETNKSLSNVFHKLKKIHNNKTKEIIERN